MAPSADKTTSNRSGRPDYKAKLDEAALRAKQPPSEESESSGILDKVSQYIPAVGRMLGNQEKEKGVAETSPAGNEIPGPPHRPEHDAQIEEFIKDQHHSKHVVGVDAPKPTK